MELNGYHAWFSDVSAILLIVLLDGGLNKSRVGHARTGLVWIVISVGMSRHATGRVCKDIGAGRYEGQNAA